MSSVSKTYTSNAETEAQLESVIEYYKDTHNTDNVSFIIRHLIFEKYKQLPKQYK
jgi:hypothetical protein